MKPLTKELSKTYKDRLKEDIETLRELYNLDVTNLSDNDLHNIITRCNWIIQFRHTLSEDEK